jgi:hypothetical protein
MTNHDPPEPVKTMTSKPARSVARTPFLLVLAIAVSAAYSAAGNAATDPLAPSLGGELATPTAVVALNPTSATITLVWSGSQAAFGYNVYRNGALVGTSASAAATTYIDAGLSPDSEYWYTVSAYNSSVESPQSAGILQKTTGVEPPGGRIGYRFPTNQERWDEFLESRDGSYAFPIYDADPVNGADHYDLTHVSPYIEANLARAHAQKRGLKVLGHVDGKGTRTQVAAIKAKIDAWYGTFPDIDGIYVGDAGYSGPTGDPTARRLFMEYWGEIAAYIHAKGGLAIFHGGITNDVPFNSAVESDLRENSKQLLRYYETIALYESYWADQPEPTLYSWMQNNIPGDSYDYSFRFRYEIFANGVAGRQLGQIADYFLARNVGYLYLTNVDHHHEVFDGSLDARDDSTYWACESAFLQLTQPDQCRSYR